nr:uncharacterized protein LOC104103595 [Nicotiana tomentosiformis]
MGSEMEIVEQRLKAFVGQLQTEFAILDRLVHKNKNQHRRCSYFQYLLKVRRDLRLLQAANLEEVLSASFQILYGKRPKQKVQLLESLKRRRTDGGKHNFLERLLGVAHLLTQVSLFSFSLLVVLLLKPFIQVCKATHGIGLPYSAYREDWLLEFTVINNCFSLSFRHLPVGKCRELLFGEP